MDKIIEVNQLSKSYGKLQAVRNIDFYVEKGKLFAYLGTNGAGKSTTIDMISTFLEPDSGSVFIDGLKLGKENDEIRRKIGVVFQDNVLDAILTVKENLNIRAGFYGLKGEEKKRAVRQAAASADILEFMNQPYGKLSGGQRRRTDIARALLHTPEILFLDEPTTGLDPQSRKKVWDMVTRLQKDRNMTVFLTTHYMEEAAAADYIIIMDHGSIAAKGTPLELRECYSRDMLRIKACPGKEKEMEKALAEMNCAYRMKKGTYEITIKETKAAIPVLNRTQQLLESFETIHGSLDDAFLQIAGKGSEDKTC